MKKTVLLLLVGIIFQQLVFAQGKVTFKPEKPKAGDEVTVSYNPQGTKLADANEVTLLVHQFGVLLSSSDEYKMAKSGKDWTAKFKMADTSKGAFVKFSAGEEKDNNSKKGFIVLTHDASGKIVGGANASVGLVQMYYGDLVGVEADKEKSYELMREDLDENPSLKKDYLTYYISAISSALKEKGNELILAELGAFTNPSELNEAQLNAVVNGYMRAKAADKAAPFQKVLMEKYPEGSAAQAPKFMEFRSAKDLEMKLKVGEEYISKFPKGNYVSYIQGVIVNEYIKAGQFDKAIEYTNTKIAKPTAMNYNTLAWALYEKDAELKTAEELAAKGVELGRGETVNPERKRGFWETMTKFKQSNLRSLGMILDTYGAILLKLGKNEEAVKALAEAVELADEQEGETNERYVNALVAVGNTKEAQTKLEKYMSGENATAKMRELLKNVYVRQNGNETGFDKYVAAFEKAAFEKKIANLKKELLNEPAPQFSLLDLDGKKVSLADLKDKTVIVDFWATWCGPCLASFPGMKKAVEKYEAGGKVKFLFVNTWENVEDKKKNATDFITKNSYPFHVLLDDKNEVITAYKVSGIPTKFIIDGKGNIRFKSVGFGGDTDKLVDELGLMIGMIQ
ncbi:MAG: redoxin domain-containing protein [Ignavibacteriales bacterium]|nr:redoxin domain-containing protein [Ignavibacteriales bacterium]